MRFELLFVSTLLLVAWCRGERLPNTVANHSAARLFSIMESLYPLKTPTKIFSDLFKMMETSSLTPYNLAQFGKESVDRIGDIDDAGYETDIDTGYGNGIFNHLVSLVLNMFGLDDSNMGRMAVNMVTYAGQLIANYLTGSSQIDDNLPRYRLLAEQGFVPFTREIIQEADRHGRAIQAQLLNEEVTDNMITTLQENTGTTTSCVQLFLCKLTPVVNTVQRAVNNSILQENQYRSLWMSSQMFMLEAYNRSPSLKEYIARGQHCNSRHPTCTLIDFSQK